MLKQKSTKLQMPVPVQNGLHPNWRGLKIDIFNNKFPGDKIKFNFIKNDGSTQSLVASFRSEPREIFRNVDEEILQTRQWQIIRQVYNTLQKQNIDFRASKLALPKKKGVTNSVAFVFEDSVFWLITLIYDEQIFQYEIPKINNLTPAQIKGNICASRYFGAARAYKLISLKDLGL